MQNIGNSNGEKFTSFKSKNCSFSAAFQQLIGGLMYLAVMTGPDISFTVIYLSQFNNCFNNVHWQCAKRVL